LLVASENCVAMNEIGDCHPITVAVTFFEGGKILLINNTKEAVKGWAAGCRRHFWNSSPEETSEKNLKLGYSNGRMAPQTREHDDHGISSN